MKVSDFTDASVGKELPDGIAASPNWWRNIRGARFTANRKQAFYSELQLLLDAGMDLSEAIRTLRQGNHKGVCDVILPMILEGETFSESFSSIQQAESFEVGALQIGEETGNLSAVLSELSLYYKGKVELKRELLKLLSYPALVLFVAVGVLYFMLVAVLPLFDDVFQSFGGELPAMTRILIQFSNFLIAYGLYLLLGIVSLIYVIYKAFQNKSVRLIWSTQVIKIPIIGTYMKKVQIARFAQFMNLLLKAEVPLSTGLKLASSTFKLEIYKDASEEICESVINGAGMAESFSQYPKLFEGPFVAMIRAAEELNELPKVFERTTKLYREELKNFTDVFGKLAEPLLIVFIAVLIGTILIAMYLPLFKMGDVMV